MVEWRLPAGAVFLGGLLMKWVFWENTAINLALMHQILFENPTCAKISGFLPATDQDETSLVTFTIKGLENVQRLREEAGL